jgi:hypothetical protein
MGILHSDRYSEVQFKKRLRERFIIAQVGAITLRSVVGLRDR